ncbi:MAG: hypothetical protein EXX96DRAFT_217895 [Benjaminiella poitrasii]|nr:MAG: hypothetical protein EXX96DRAFT_217895 [Benjaminiella poitrasii]
MTLLVTRNCHYAIIVAIGDGEDFKAEEDKDFCVRSQLNLILPSQLQDLIPPNTRLSTKPTTFHESVRIRTTLVYYVSNQLLKQLMKTKSSITLDFVSISVSSAENPLGSIEFTMNDAKMVKIHEEKSDIKTIESFVIDKGEWLSVGNDHIKGKIQAGLFIVEMPHNAKVPTNNTVGRPIDTPSRLSNSRYHNVSSLTLEDGNIEFGLEICSDTSELFANDLLDMDVNDEEETSESIVSELMIDEEEKQLECNNSESEGEETTEVIKVGNGMEQYSLMFRILKASHLLDMTSHYSDIEEAFFQYKIGNQMFKCPVQHDEDDWNALGEIKQQIFFVGDLPDIKIWLEEEQVTVDVFLVVKQANEEECFLIGYSKIYFVDKGLGIHQQSSVIYDQNEQWHINTQKQFAQLHIQVGLIEGWESLVIATISAQQ